MTSGTELTKTSLENLYTAVACNRTLEAADWGSNKLIAYGACMAVVIFDPNYDGAAKIVCTLVKHTARVNTVKWVKHRDLIISGSDDGLCIVWDVSDLKCPSAQIIKGHADSLTTVASIVDDERLLIATASSDSSVKLWTQCLDSKEFECIQTISVEPGYCFALAFHKLPLSGKLVMALATHDESVRLYSQQAGELFVHVDTLLGHEDWVRGLDFVETDDNNLMLASCSQDTFIRLWKISAVVDVVSKQCLNGEFDDTHELQIEKKTFKVSYGNDLSMHYAVALESVLQGHEGWVYGVHWNRDSKSNTLQILSSSIDKTAIVWKLTEEGVWMEKIRVGEVGGMSLGFFGGKFSPDGKSLMTHGFLGSFHLWNQSNVDENTWSPGVVVGGHYQAVRDICWENDGQYLLSVSADQTTRVHVQWMRENSSNATWHELARPQVHGYDMQCICSISSLKFASAAEEKIVRTFQAPENFVQNFQTICKSDKFDHLMGVSDLPKGASVPSLGLSNKAVFNCEETNQEQKHVKDQYPENYFTPVTLTEPPTEETLMQNTLWSELQKLYGHGFEVMAICCTLDGLTLASSCKASTAEHAQIILWDTQTSKQIGKLESHQLTVTQMKFSSDNRYLLSVSRDRSWTVFEQSSSEDRMYIKIAKSDKKSGIHSRIIWSCDWSHDAQKFVTGSRDGKAVVWQDMQSKGDPDQLRFAAQGVLELKSESITAVAFAASNLDVATNSYLIAIGLESGLIHLYAFSENWRKLTTIDRNFGHHLTVHRLCFRPKSKNFELASCGDDHIVRINCISIEK